jgi:3'-5' exoribonuclease
MPHQGLDALAVGDRVARPLLVLEVERRDGAAGPFTTLALGDASGRLGSAPFWAGARAPVAALARGDVVEVTGEVGEYRGQRQLRVASIRALPRASAPWDELLPSIGDPAPWWARLDRLREGIAAPRLRAVLARFFDEPAFRARFGRCPAATRGHHARLGGLLQHTWEVAHVARRLARLRPRADADLLVAGALLHDVGKVEAYRWDGPFEPTAAGALVGHVALGLVLLDRAVRTPPAPCTDDEHALLAHLVASHHGRLEFGATVPPMTLEAELLHFADDASAKAESMDEALANPAHFEADAPLSRRRLWEVGDRRLWRGRATWGR